MHVAQSDGLLGAAHGNIQQPPEDEEGKDDTCFEETGSGTECAADTVAWSWVVDHGSIRWRSPAKLVFWRPQDLIAVSQHAKPLPCGSGFVSGFRSTEQPAIKSEFKVNASWMFFRTRFSAAVNSAEQSHFWNQQRNPLAFHSEASRFSSKMSKHQA